MGKIYAIIPPAPTWDGSILSGLSFFAERIQHEAYAEKLCGYSLSNSMKFYTSKEATIHFLTTKINSGEEDAKSYRFYAIAELDLDESSQLITNIPSLSEIDGCEKNTVELRGTLSTQDGTQIVQHVTVYKPNFKCREVKSTDCHKEEALKLFNEAYALYKNKGVKPEEKTTEQDPANLCAEEDPRNFSCGSLLQF